MRTKRILTVITAITLCITAASAAGEIHSKDIESNGKVIETVWLDDNGQPATGPEGYTTVRYTYKRELTTEEYLDADGQPVQASGGYYRKAVTRDGKGNVIQIEYQDQKGERVLNRWGYAAVTMSYTGFGAVKLVTYTGLNKRAVTVPSLGYASVLTQYSNKTMTSKTFRDEKGKPVDNVQGFAVIRQKLNKRYQVLSTRYDHADGSPATGPDGWFRCVKDRDDQGRVTAVSYYDVNSQLTDRGAGYAQEKYAYEGNNIVKLTRCDAAGGVITDASGVATLVREMKDDRIIRESFLDSEGKRTNNSLGVGGILYSYDQRGGIEKVMYQDTEGNPALCTGGYAGYHDTKDEDGVTVSRIFLGTDGLAAETPGGYSEIRYFYNEFKQLTSTRYYDLNGKQVQAE